MYNWLYFVIYKTHANKQGIKLKIDIVIITALPCLPKCLAVFQMTTLREEPLQLFTEEYHMLMVMPTLTDGVCICESRTDMCDSVRCHTVKFSQDNLHLYYKLKAHYCSRSRANTPMCLWQGNGVSGKMTRKWKCIHQLEREHRLDARSERDRINMMVLIMWHLLWKICTGIL